MKLEMKSASFATAFMFFLFLLYPLRVQAEEVVKVAGGKHFPPYQYLNEYGMYQGFFVDLLNAITIESGININFYPMEEELSKHTLERGLIQGIVGVPYTQENSKKFLLTKPLLRLSESIIVTAQTQQIFDRYGLKNQKVAISPYSAAYEKLKHDRSIRFVFTETPQESIELLLEKKVNVAIMNKATAYYIAQQTGKTNGIKAVGDPVTEEYFGIALAWDQKALRDKINAGIDSLIKNGTYDKIHKKWFGETFTDPIVKVLKRLLIIVAFGVGLILLVTILTLRWNYLLKKEVAHRTKVLQEVNTALQQKQQEVLEQMYFKDLIFNNVNDAIIMLNRNGFIQSANTKSLEYFQCNDLDVLLHSKFSDSVIGQKIDPELLNRCLSRGMEQRGIEIAYMNQWNEKLTLDVSLYPFINQDLQRDGVILVIRDVTTEKQLRENMYRQGKLQALGQLVAGVAHELRNPLMAIETFIQVLPEKYDSPTFRERFITHISKEVERLNRVTSDLLDFGKPKVPHKEVFSFRQLMDEIIAVFRPSLEQREIRLELDIRNDAVYADRSLMKQVLINLLINAMDAIGYRGLISVISKIEEQMYCIVVKDTGKGIEEQDLGRIFDPFFTTKAHGVGLGLSISHQFITDQQGTISVSSRAGDFTTFVIHLPISRFLQEGYYEGEYSDHRR